MSMHNTEWDFYGKQEGEKILYVVRPHFLGVLSSVLKIYLVVIVISSVFFILASQIASLGSLFSLLGALFLLGGLIIGTKIVFDWQSRNIAYITDRRLVRFEPTTLVATNSRSLSWDEAVKVKTYPPNFIWKQLAIGNVTVHARTTIRTAEDTPKDTVSADDIELKDVYFYRDLGNYIDKILFIYKQKSGEVSELRPFVPRPRGQRY